MVAKKQKDQSSSLHDPALAAGRIDRSTQKYLDIAEIREDCVVLKNGALRAVILVSNVNFALLSDEEQEAIVLGFQNFLNSLDFPIQIVVESRILEIQPYLDLLLQYENSQVNELLREQTRAYREFISGLVTDSNIMEKRFYIVVPFSLIENKEEGIMSRIKKALNPSTIVSQKKEKFEVYRGQLMQRADQIVNSISAMGMSGVLLNTRQLIELYYSAYNPKEGTQPSLGDVTQLELQTSIEEPDAK
jgi:type IV secretory pathway VirB4 component